MKARTLIGMPALFALACDPGAASSGDASPVVTQRSATLVHVCSLGDNPELPSCRDRLPEIVEVGVYEAEPEPVYMPFPAWLEDLINQCMADGIHVIHGDIVSFEPNPTREQCVHWAVRNIPRGLGEELDWEGYWDCCAATEPGYFDCVMTETDNGNTWPSQECYEEMMWDQMVCAETHL